MHFLIGSAIVVATWCYLTGNGTNYRPFWRFLSFCLAVLVIVIVGFLLLCVMGEFISRSHMLG